MLVASWNVNSILARLPRLIEWLGAEKPDVACLQETKVQDSTFPHAALAEVGYRAQVRGQRTYNGVAVLTRLDAPVPTVVQDRLEGLVFDGDAIDEARFLMVGLAGMRIASVYVPNGRDMAHPHAIYKRQFYTKLEAVAQAAAGAKCPLLLTGDFNVAPREEDVCDPAHWSKSVLFHPTMRESLHALLAHGLIDSLPMCDPTPNQYTWWDYRALSFVKDKGLRIDLLLASDDLKKRTTGAGVHRYMRKGDRPSDHVPAWIRLS